MWEKGLILARISSILWKTFVKWAHYARDQAKAPLCCSLDEFLFPIRIM